MKMHTNHMDVVLNACWVLKNMSVNDSYRVAIITQGGVAVSHDVKKNHSGNGEIQEIADGLLAALQ